MGHFENMANNLLRPIDAVAAVEGHGIHWVSQQLDNLDGWSATTGWINGLDPREKEGVVAAARLLVTDRSTRETLAGPGWGELRSLPT